MSNIFNNGYDRNHWEQHNTYLLKYWLSYSSILIQRLTLTPLFCSNHCKQQNAHCLVIETLIKMRPVVIPLFCCLQHPFYVSIDYIHISFLQLNWFLYHCFDSSLMLSLISHCSHFCVRFKVPIYLNIIVISESSSYTRIVSILN